MALTGPRVERKLTPLLRPHVLEKLEIDLNNELVYQRFVETYVQRWPIRYDRLCTAIAAGGTKQAAEALLSLKIACALVGALRLHELVCTLEHHLQQGSDEPVAQTLQQISMAGNATVAAVSRKCPTGPSARVLPAPLRRPIG